MDHRYLVSLNGRSYESIYEFIIATGSRELCSGVILTAVLLELYRKRVTYDAFRIPTCRSDSKREHAK